MNDVKKLVMNSLSTVESPRDVKGWIISFNSACEVINVPADKKLPVAASYMRGYLATWTARKREQNPSMTWDDFKALLEQEFVDSSEVTKAQDRLLRIKQLQGEKVARYVQRIRKLVVVSGCDADNDIVIRTFVNGLNNPLIRANVAISKPQSFEMALVTATECAAAVVERESNRPGRKDTYTGRHASQQGRGQWRRRGASSYRRGNDETSSSTRGGDRSMKRAKVSVLKRDDRRCFNCNERGHIAQRCPQKRAFQTNTVMSSEESEPSRQVFKDTPTYHSGNGRTW
jgi:hypothetical protein